MNCAEIVELMPLHFSGELDAVHAREFAAHLAVCGACAQRVREQAALDLQLREALAVHPTESEAEVFNRGFRAQMAQGTLATTPHPHHARWILAVAAALLFAIAGFAYRSVLLSRSSQAYIDAAEDHHDEVVEQQKRVWVRDSGAIAALAEKRGISPQTLLALAPAGYKLDRARVCSLDREPYLHLVYTAATGDFSVFLRPRGSRTLRGSSGVMSDGKHIYTADRGAEHVAGLQGSQLTAFVVTDQPGDSALRFAESVAGTL